MMRQYAACSIRRFSVFVAITSCSFGHIVCAQSSSGAAEKGVPLSGQQTLETLEMIAAQLRGNYELIKTWNAKYDFVDKFWFPGQAPGAGANAAANAAGFLEVTSGTVDFQWDSTADKLHVLYKPTKPLVYVDLATGKPVERADPGDIYHWIITPEHWLEFGANVYLGQLQEFPNVATVPPTGGRIAHRKVRTDADRFTRVFRPLDLFSNQSMPFWRHCQLYAEALGGKDGPEKKQKAAESASLAQRTGKTTSFVLTITYPHRADDGPVRSETIFDSSVGFQPVSWKRWSGTQLTNSMSVSYKKTSDVYLPAKFHFERFDIDRSGAKTPFLARTFVLMSSNLNGPIQPRRFGIEQFDLKYGERMLDQIENRLYVKDKTELVPVESFSADPQKVPVVFTGKKLTQERNWTLIILNVVVVIGLVAIVAFRRFKVNA